MPLILVVEPDGRQTDALASLLTGRLHAELVQAHSAADGVARLDGRVPDLILIAPLLSPKDDAVLAGHLRDLGRAAAHVQTLTIPVLETSRPGGRRGGVLSKLRRSRDNGSAPDGCDPRLFAEEVALYLTRAAEEQQAAASYAVATDAVDDVPPETLVPVVATDIQSEPEIAAASAAPEPIAAPLVSELAALHPIEEGAGADELDGRLESADVDAQATAALEVAAETCDLLADALTPAAPLPAEELTAAVAVEDEAPTLVCGPDDMPPPVQPDVCGIVAASADAVFAEREPESEPASLAANELSDLDLGELTDLGEFTFVIEGPAIDVARMSPGATDDVAQGQGTRLTHTLLPVTDAVVIGQATDLPEPERIGPMQWARDAIANIDTIYAAVRAALGQSQPQVVVLDAEAGPAEPLLAEPTLAVDDELLEAFTGDTIDVRPATVAEEPVAELDLLDLTDEIEALSLAGYTAFVVRSDEASHFDVDGVADLSQAFEEAETIEAAQCYEIDVVPQPVAVTRPAPDPAPARVPAPPRLRVERPAAKPEPAKAPRRRRTKDKPIQDEWGMFDPSQCGFAALVDKLEEVTDDEDHDDRTSVRVVSYQ